MSRFERLLVSFNPAVAAGIYTANDQLGAVNTLSDSAESDGGSVELESVTILDTDKQKKALDLFFFSELPTLVSADHDEFELSAANIAKCIGAVSIGATDYVDTKTSAVASLTNLGLILQVKKKTRTLYVVAVTRSTPTYTAAGSIIVRLGLLQP